MDLNSDEYQLKELLVNLEQEHKHLQVSVEHLSNDVIKRELEIRKLLAERELELARTASSRDINHATGEQKDSKIAKSQSVDFGGILSARSGGANTFSSDYNKQVSDLLDKITQTSEEVLGLVKL